MSKETRWKQSFQSFNNAYSSFQRMIAHYEKAPDSEVAQMALTQAFEFTVEISWKLLKNYLEKEGFDIHSPKEAIRQAFQSEIILGEDSEIWMRALEMRNLTSHVYNKEALQTLLEYIDHSFQSAVQRLHDSLKDKL